MERPEFPPNSEVSKRQQEKNIERVTTGEARRKRPSLRKQFRDTFVSGTIKGSLQFVVLDVLLPAAKDMVVEAVAEGAHKLFFGEGRRYRGRSSPPPSGPYGHVNYTQYAGPSATRPSSQRAMSRRARAAQDFDEIVLDSRTEAEEVIDRLYDLVGKYDIATVADLYELVGLPSGHTDYKWGWADLHGAGVSRIRDGYLLDLPDPIPLD